MFWCPNSGDECEHTINPNPRSAFLIMPYNYPEKDKKEIEQIEKIIKECFAEIEFSVRTAREIKQSRNLLCKICENMQSVGVGVVVYTENTPGTSFPNIFYEAGIMHSLGKEVIFVGYNIKIPSDLSGLEWILINDLDELGKEMRNRLKELPKQQSYYIKLGEIAKAAGNYEKALEYYMKAALISPTESLGYINDLYNRIKGSSEYKNLSKRVNNFIRLL